MLPNSLRLRMRHFRFDRLTLRQRIALFIVLITIPIIVFAHINGRQRVAREIDQIQTHVLNIAQVAASSQNQHIDSAHQLLITLAQLPAVQALDGAMCNTHVSQLLPSYPSYTIISAVDRSGQTFCSTSSTMNTNFSQTTWFERVLTTEEFTVGDFQVDVGGEITRVSYGYPIHNQADEIIGAMIVTEHLGWLNDWLANIQLPFNTHLTLLDQQGVILTHVPSATMGQIGASITDPQMLTALTNAPHGTLETAGEHAETWLYGFTRLNDDLPIYVVVGMPKAEALANVHGLLARNRLTIAVIVISIAVLAMICGTYFIIKPIERLNRTIGDLAGGAFQTQTNLPGSVGELKRLGRSIDQLSNALVSKEQELDKVIKRMQAEIKKRERAQAADQLKLRFLGMVAHELQTPLTSIKGFATTLLAEDVTWDEANQRRFLQLINEETDNVRELIVQLLDLSQIEAGMMRIQPIETCIVRIAEDARPHLLALTKNHRLKLKLAQHIHKPIIADPKRVTQVLVNLVSNAAKYAPEQSTIVIDAQQQYTHIQVNVRDEGSGIPEDQLKRVFMPFIRSENWLDKHEGTGLGLAICKGIIDAHGGKIWAENHKDSVGVTVSFTLPLVQSAVESGSQPALMDDEDESQEYDEVSV